ncbi:hypothetical protein [Streptomyces chartreusis]|uniref:hypothetical protein n=1 Tax=Streptomyces chartreusis TaxID=1969 RepID=UPI00364E3671
MNRGEQLPAEQPSDNAVLSAGARIAMQWRDLGADQLAAALRAMEPELRREHRLQLMRLELEREEAQRKHTERREQRENRRRIAELAVGAVVALAMLGGGVYVAPESWWLSCLLCGPSLLALVKIFVLRRSDPGDMAAVAGAARTATNAATPQPPPPVP